MNKKTIIYIACGVAIALIIAISIYFILVSNKSESGKTEQKITLTKYDENFDVAKTIEITNKKQMKEIEKICDNSSLEQDEEHQNYGIKNDVKLDLGNNRFFMIQLDILEYCYYEDAASGTKLIIKMPEGLLDKVNQLVSEN